MKLNFSLEEKIGQIILTGFHGKNINENSSVVKDILNHHLGNLWFTDKDDFINGKYGNIESPQQLKKLTTDLQNFSNNKLFIAIDAEGGNVIRLKEKYGFPKTLSAKFLGDKNDFALTRENSTLIAETLIKAGININFAPVVDLNINKDLNIISKKERSFSDNPDIVFQHAKEFILAHKEKNVVTCLKHFPGHGSAVSDTHDGFVDSTKYWNEKELIPYKLLIEENLADAIMISHIYNKNLDEKFPSSLSKKIINDLLRDKLSFNGLIFTDDLDMKAIDDNYSLEKSLELAINAGADIIIKSNLKNPIPDLVAKIIKAIKKLIDQNIITEKRIDESFERIILAKKKLGLMNS